MGWNSWDGYGTAIDEEQFKANAKWMAEHLKASGWEYAVIDMEWFVTNPKPSGNSKDSKFLLDEFGRYLPPPARFPSARCGQGSRPLPAYPHSLGLKFRSHILQGIPRQEVEQNMPN